MKLVQSSVCVENTLLRSFNRRGRAVKHVQTCLSASEDRESCFHRCAGPVKLVQTCL